MKLERGGWSRKGRSMDKSQGLRTTHSAAAGRSAGQGTAEDEAGRVAWPGSKGLIHSTNIH